MSEDCTGKPAPPSESQQAFDEAEERQKRLKVWLEGLLSGGPSLAEAVKPWRQALTQSGALAQTSAGAEDEENLPGSNARSDEELLIKARRSVREGRELTGKAAVDLTEEERARREEQMIEGIRRGRMDGVEFTPLHWVLAARYVEGYFDFEEYRMAVLRL